MHTVGGLSSNLQRLPVHGAEVDEVGGGGGLCHIHRAAFQYVGPRRDAREARRERQVVPDGLGRQYGPRLEAQVRNG